jgi:flagellar biosynthesis protein
MKQGVKKTSANKRAIALKYDADRGTAPIITAVGKGQVAEKIIEVAEGSGVARVEDELQANALSAFDAGSRVPKFLYDLVAEVLLFIEEADIVNQNKLQKYNGGAPH